MQLLFWCESSMVKAKACVCAFPSLHVFVCTEREREERDSKREGPSLQSRRKRKTQEDPSLYNRRYIC